MTEHFINVLRIILGKESFEDAAAIASELQKLSAIDADKLSTTLDKMYTKLFLLELKTLREILVKQFDAAIDIASKTTTSSNKELVELSDDEIRVNGE